MSLKQQALDFHSFITAGKIKIESSKELNYQNLKLCYTPGVAFPCLEIFENKENAYKYTSKGNLVAIISNGSAVLGLGNLGAIASKPVMEGKANLLRYLAGINAIDVEIEEINPEKIIEVVEKISCTFGGINLEDIKAPECFGIEKTLVEKLEIPLMHDDQHGTSIAINAALHNSLKLIEKNPETVKIVISGAGAAAIASAEFLLNTGFLLENIFMFDSKGLIKNSTVESKKKFNKNFDLTLDEALVNADVFIGLSKENILNENILKMNKNPIIFALANPTPEIDYNYAKKIRPDAIVATGRSDFPNQINNLLVFPYIFRIALDLRVKIDDKLKIACSKALQSFMANKISKESILPNAFNPALLYYITNYVFNYLEEKMPEKYFDNLDWLVYGSSHLLIERPIYIEGDEQNKEMLNDLFEVKKIDKISEKSLVICKIEDIISQIKGEYELVFDNFKTKDEQIIKQLPNQFIGLILENKVFFNNQRRVWYALKLL